MKTRTDTVSTQMKYCEAQSLLVSKMLKSVGISGWGRGSQTTSELGRKTFDANPICLLGIIEAIG